jgi:uncharacterized protein
VDQAQQQLVDTVLRNPRVREVLHVARDLALPDWYLTAGCLFQSVWNVLDDHPPERGIRDYDIFYYDATDLSWQAENGVIQRARAVFADRQYVVEVRNEARVHLWYEKKFGVACPRFRSSRDAIDHFAATTCSVGVRLEQDDSFSVYTPYGLDDLFGFILRPNPTLAPRQVYEAKAARWRDLWPRLTVLAWPEDASLSPG